MNSSLGYSFVPKKILRKNPVYSMDCPNCKSNNTLPLPGEPQSFEATFRCSKCQTTFKPIIVKYNEYIDEVFMNYR